MHGAEAEELRFGCAVNELPIDVKSVVVAFPIRLFGLPKNRILWLTKVLDASSIVQNIYICGYIMSCIPW